MISPVLSHPWNLSEREAEDLQRALAEKVTLIDTLTNEIHHVAGVDVAYDKHKDRLIAVVAVISAETLDIEDMSVVEDEEQFPYIPGLFSFREIPPVVKAMAGLTVKPDLLVCDGHGLAHPRRFGVACHLGVLFDIPAIGCGKTRLTGTFDPVGENRGDYSNLIDQGEVIGCALRTQDTIKPVYVSVGHRISLETARKWILRLAPTYRLPETTRQADHEANRVLKYLQV